MTRIFVSILSIVTLVLAGSAFLQDYDLAKSIERGKDVYTANCIDCHMAGGIDPQGQYPPLAKSDYLQKSADSLIKVILHGQSGVVLVNGKKYDDQMLGEDFLNDAQIADVLNYIRNSWDNKFPVIIPQQVAALRK